MKATEISPNVDYAYLTNAGGYNRGTPLKAHTLELLGAGKVRVRFIHPDPEVGDWEATIPTRKLVRLWSDDDSVQESKAWSAIQLDRELADRMTKLGLTRNRLAFHGKGGLVRSNSYKADAVNVLTMEELDMLLSAAEAAVNGDSLWLFLDKAQAMFRAYNGLN